MQLASIPKAVVTANQQVVDSMKTASALTRQTQSAFEDGGVKDVQAAVLDRALGHAQDAAKGVDELGNRLMLDGPFQRWTTHAVRRLEDAVAMLDRGSLSKDGVGIFTKTLFDAEVATRLAAEAGERSMARPAVRGREQASSGDGGGSTTSGGPTWVDGTWLDELGNPVRGGGDDWAGPDGERYGSDGSPSGDGGWVGPDGEGYSGI